jgi:excinuclease ABC subunit A
MYKINEKKIIPNPKLSIKNGGLAPQGSQKNSWIFKQIELIAKRYKFSLSDPISKIPKDALELILYGGKDKFSVESKSLGISRNYDINFDGIANFIEYQYKNSDSNSVKRWAKNYMDKVNCPSCGGSRLNKVSRYFKINNKNISDLVEMDISDLAIWFNDLPNYLSKKQNIIAKEIVKEINTRLQFLLDVGLNYLNLNRSSKTLSGGESQRIRLATQIGSELLGVLYILDEPSIGLHQRDNQKLIKSLISLKDIGNSVIVVEHDKEMIEKADYVIDIGPNAGKNGGAVISQGSPKELKRAKTITGAYLRGEIAIDVPKKKT